MLHNATDMLIGRRREITSGMNKSFLITLASMVHIMIHVIDSIPNGNM